MVNYDTGVQDPEKPEDDLTISDGNGLILVTDDEESDDQETIVFDEYHPLPMDDSAESNAPSSEDEDNDADNTLPHITPIEETLVNELWSSPTPKEVDIEMDSKKIDEVKKAMTNITLPSSAVPEWATNIPEDSWKQLIMKRIHGEQCDN